MSSRVAVVGGGLAGLVTAFRLRHARPDLAISLYESSSALGGKIRTTPFMGRPVDEGPDAFLTRVPWAVDLTRELGITDRVVSPSTGSAYVVVKGRMRRLPEGLALGVPVRFWPLLTSGIVSPPAALRAGLDLVRGDDWPGDDESVGGLIRRRLGPQIHERLVDPLIGSIYAGRTEHLDLQLIAPQLETAARRNRSLIRGLRAQRRAGSTADGPIFHGFRNGMAQLVDALVSRLRGVEIRTGTRVEALRRAHPGVELTTTDGTDTFDAVVLAAPAHAAGPMVAGASPAASELMGGIPFASVTLVTMGLRRSDVGHRLDGSGALIPAQEGWLSTAASWGSSKWPHWADDDRVVLRVSSGRDGDERAMGLDDDVLVDSLLQEMATLLDIRGELLEWRVSRWPRSFAQYRPGHGRRVTEIESQLRRDLPGLFVTGASYRGIGIPAVVRQAGEATTAVLDHLRVP